jgi:hypothetical protein
MRGLARPILFIVTLFLAFASTRAYAWTDATVRTGTAEIELLEDGYANVTMRVRVRVNGGWLEGFDIEGLDRDAVFDPAQPPVFLDETGIARPVEFTPRPGGRIQLRFRRAGAPHRGEYEIELHYRTHLDGLVREEDDGSLEVAWVFPAWRFGLDDVEVVWLAPAGTRPFDADTEASPIEIVTSSTDARERILYRRPHLPRTSDWTTRIHVSASAWPYTPSVAPTTTEAADASDAAETDAQETVTESPAHAAAPTTVRATQASPAWHASMLLVALAIGAWLKRRGLAQRARLVPAIRVLPLLPLPWSWLGGAIALITLAVAVAACFVAVPLELEMALAVTCAALGWHRFETVPGQPRMAQLQPVSAATLRDASRDSWRPFFALDALFDPARLGLFSSLAFITFALLEGDAFVRALAAAFFALVMGSSTRAVGNPYQALRTALPLARAWQRAGFQVQFVGRLTSSFGRKPSKAAPADEVRVRIALRSQASIDATPERTLLHFPTASEAQLSALAAWSSEHQAHFDPALRTLDANCTPAQARALDALLVRVATQEAEAATLEDSSLQQAAE